MTTMRTKGYGADNHKLNDHCPKCGAVWRWAVLPRRNREQVIQIARFAAVICFICGASRGFVNLEATNGC